MKYFADFTATSLKPLLLAATWLALSSVINGALGDACQMNRKTIEYGTRSCFNENCSDVHQKVIFLGDKELVYYDANDPHGITYYDGRSVDLTSDELQQVEHSTAPPGTTETATAASVRNNLDFQFTQHRQLRNGNGDVISNYWQEVGIRILSCGTCELTLYRVRGNYGDNSVLSTFEPGWCRFVS